MWFNSTEARLEDLERKSPGLGTNKTVRTAVVRQTRKEGHSRAKPLPSLVKTRAAANATEVSSVSRVSRGSVCYRAVVSQPLSLPVRHAMDEKVDEDDAPRRMSDGCYACAANSSEAANSAYFPFTHHSLAFMLSTHKENDMR